MPVDFYQVNDTLIPTFVQNGRLPSRTKPQRRSCQRKRSHSQDRDLGQIELYGRESMQGEYNNILLVNKASTRELANRIQKLRWIGLEEEAQGLALAVRNLPPEERGCVSSGPFSTD